MQIIGIILREDITKEQNEVFVLYKNLVKAFQNCILVAITNYNENILDFCDGVIGEGGDDIKEEDLQIIKYCYKHDIPYLGICLGMQEMSVLFDGTLKDLKNNHHHKKEDYVHEVHIVKDSYLYSIFNKENIKVNSRHKSYVENTSLDKVGYANTIIEAVEDQHKKFFVGVQWHPESMIEYDADAKKIIDTFLNKCKERQDER